MSSKDSPVLICSHKRSGTHLLAATLWKNFQLPDMLVVAPIHQGKRFVLGEEEWSVGERARIPWGGLWGSHNFYNSNWVKSKGKILYIVRHPARTLMSYWRFLDPECHNDPDLYLGEYRVRFWYRHARGYTKNCHWIRYEDLVGEEHDVVLDRVREWFGLKKKERRYHRVKERVGWYSADVPTQLKQPEQGLIETCANVLPDGFLGYDIRNPWKSYVMEGR